LTAAQGWAEERAGDFVALDEALARLVQLEPRPAQVLELRFFGGLQENEIAEVLRVSTITVKRDWKVARASLLSELFPSASSKRE
jgi:DNA-directed RNA polymerase specialized sigma24 family protein